MKLAKTVASTLLFCRLNYPSGELTENTHSRIAAITGLRSAKRVGAIERGSPASVYELKLIAAAFKLDLKKLTRLARKEDRQRPTNQRTE